MNLRNMVTNIRSKRGIVLILVLVVVAILSLGAYSYTDLMRSYHESSNLAGRQLQAKMMVDSGIDYLRIFLSQPAEMQLEAGGKYDNPERFKQIAVLPSDNPRDRGYFTVVAPAVDPEGRLAGTRFGFEDESNRLNLNTLLALEKQSAGSAATLLGGLPGMTPEISDAILDWLDDDEEARPSGAESDYYLSLEPPYGAKNGPLDTVEDLLRVRGVTPQLLFGLDANRNGVIEANEQAVSLENQQTGVASSGDATTSGGIDAGVSERGWAAYLTLHSSERNLRPDGSPRIFVNSNDLQKLHAQLLEAFPPDWATFIVAYRQGGPYTGTNKGQTGIGRAPDFKRPGRTKFTQLLDLVGAKTSVTFPGDSSPTVLESPIRSDLIAMGIALPLLLDHATINPAERIPGRLNVNQAPAALLRGIPGMTEEILTKLLEFRQPEPSSNLPARRHETWILTDGHVQLTEMRLLQPFINSGGSIHRTQVVGYFQDGEAAARSEAIFDATGTLPRLVLWRDMSHLGRGYALETLGVDFSE